MRNTSMKMVRWRRFSWDLSHVPTPLTAVPDRYQIRSAHRTEVHAVAQLVIRSLALDTAWSDTLAMIRDGIEDQIALSFAREPVPALVVSHGPRIIAASVLSTDTSSESHLVSGPCVLLEYHNRGIATALLHHSLKQLANAGLEAGHGITRGNAVTAKFLYSKFGSTNIAWNPEALLVA